MTPLVLVHGGGFDRRCWDLLLPHLAGPALAVDLPGRGSRPCPVDDVDFAACAAAVTTDVDAAWFDEVVLVGHSLAGCSMPSIVARIGERVRHVVYLGCTVPPDGSSALDTLDPEIQALVAEAGPTPALPALSGELARIVLGDDLDDAQLRWCSERIVPEAMRLSTEPVSLDPVRSLPSTWLRTMLDRIVSPEKQARFTGQLQRCEVVDVDGGHMAMVSRPAAVAALLDAVADR